jgi:tetratricopeptide (TPR) repeat protein
MIRSKICIGLLLTLITFAVYWQTGSHAFINYDDTIYVTKNPHLSAAFSWEGLGWAFTSTYAANWHPLTWLSHMLDMQLYGLAPQGHHLTNAVLHSTNALLLFLLLSRSTGALWPSAFAAALFALHPLRVESVAWVAERKDLLSTLFALLSLLSYASYVARPAISRYLVTVICFAAGLMAKPMLVTLPFVMLLLDYWPLNRFSAIMTTESGRRARMPHALRRIVPLLAEKLPLMALSTASCIITFYAQQHGRAVAPIQSFPLIPRIENAIIAYGRYLGKMFYPVDLAVFYPIPQVLPWWKVGTLFLVLALTTAGIVRSARRQPYLITGWFWFLGTLVPVIGLVQVGMQSMADRYTYLPMIGIAIMLAWGAAAVAPRLPGRCWLLGIAAALVLACLVTLTRKQLAHWQNSYSLFSHAIKVTDNNFIALGYLALTLHEQKRYREAEYYYRLSLSVNPWQDDMHHNLGIAFRDLGEYADAAREFEQALKIKPSLIDTRYELALCYALNGKVQDAINHFEKVVQADPTFAKGQYSLGVAYGRQGKTEQACRHFAEAVRFAPAYREAREGLADCQRILQRDR